MKSPLDVSKLKALCEAVVRDSTGYVDGSIPKAMDEAWTRLTHDSLPALEQFMVEEDLNPLINIISQIEKEHFRTPMDTGAEPNAMFIWNIVRKRAGLPALKPEELPLTSR